ncbi:MAG TPA: Mut7-C RNAse domain-containing protein [Candidatus Methanoperedens sp.]
MKLIVDRMLGRLARWLRLLGYDTISIARQENEDDLLLTLALGEGRILVSRDRMLINKAIKKGISAYNIQSQDIIEQIKEMHKEFDILLEPRMDRCTLCNSNIRKVEAWEMKGVKEKEYVYPAVLERVSEFWICDKCGQVYWLGKHWENIRETVRKLTPENHK